LILTNRERIKSRLEKLKEDNIISHIQAHKCKKGKRGRWVGWMGDLPKKPKKP
jgi:hypothetical protein